MKFYIFVSGEYEPDFLSKKIMKRFETNYSHIGMVLEDEFDKKEIFHSVGKGFSTANWDIFLLGHHVRLIDITDKVKNAQYALGYLQGRMGIEYSFSQYLGFVFPFLRKFVRNKTEKGICSEEAARFLYHCCIHELRVDPNKFDFVSPKDVWEKLESIMGEA